jgi:hypothetical protein
LPVGPVHLHNGESFTPQNAGQFGAVAAGALNSDREDGSGFREASSDLSVPGSNGEALAVAEMGALFVNDGDVVGIGVCINTGLHTTNGSSDLVAEIRTSTLNNFDRLLGQIRSVEGVVNSETSMLLSSILPYAVGRRFCEPCLTRLELFESRMTRH